MYRSHFARVKSRREQARDYQRVLEAMTHRNIVHSAYALLAKDVSGARRAASW